MRCWSPMRRSECGPHTVSGRHQFFPSQFSHQLDHVPTGFERVEKEKPAWDTQHHILFNQVNAKLTANSRDYFDRPRQREAYGCRYDPPLFVTWMLRGDPSKAKRIGPRKGGDPKGWDIPPTSELADMRRRRRRTFASDRAESQSSMRGDVSTEVSTDGRSLASPGSSSAMPSVSPSPGPASAAASPLPSGRGPGTPLLSRSSSAPGSQHRARSHGHNILRTPPPPGSIPWHREHQILFCKDNSMYHKNYREYFDRPKDLLW